MPDYIHAPSPFTPSQFPDIPAIRGVSFAVASTGSRYTGRDDLFIARFCEGTHAAGVFTRSATASPCVAACKSALNAESAGLLIVNAGNANACTGEHGRHATTELRAHSADIFDVSPASVFHCATGVIGVRLDIDPLTAPMPAMKDTLCETASFETAARAIMTTDTFPKAATITADIGGAIITFSAIAKGSGMIAPDMATMLAFIFTDADIEPALLQRLFAESCEKTYNAITVDGDTSTNDTSLIFATGRAGNTLITEKTPSYARTFSAALDQLNTELALLIVGDGEGITTRLDITVSGAETARDARTIAMSVANSPLVKTAFFGADPNWGRIMMAIGKAGVSFALEDVSISVAGIDVALHGEAAENVDLGALSRAICNADIVPIHIQVGDGKGFYTAYSTDLSYEYIRINAEYTS